MGRVPYHEFVGALHKCGLRTCQLGRAASVHRKPKDFPEPRLVVAEADIRRLKAGFTALADGIATMEEVLRTIGPFLGASGSQLFIADEKWRKCVKALNDYRARYAPKAKPDGGKSS